MADVPPEGDLKAYIPPMDQRCNKCKWWAPDQECRWYPPAVVWSRTSSSGVEIQYKWPQVGPQDWCGVFTPTTARMPLSLDPNPQS